MPQSRRKKQRVHREKNRLCPLCKELFTAQGLSGHLRMAHGLSRENAADMLSRSEVTDPAQMPAKPDPAQLEAVSEEPSMWPTALVLAGVVLAGAVALINYGYGANVIGCGRCGQKIDITNARREGVQLVQCPNAACHAVIDLR